VTEIRRVDLSPAEWIAGTLGMSLEEEAIYVRIVMRIYNHGGALPADPAELARLCGVRPQTMRRILPKLMGKFVETDGKLTSNRCETELKLARNRIETRRINGAKGGRPNGLDEPAGYSPRADARNYQPSTTKIEDSEEAYASPGASAPFGDPVKDMWDRGKAVLGKSAGGLIGKARRDHGDEAVVAAIVACEHEGPVEPVEFFMGCLRRNSNKRTAMEKLYAGAMEAADEFTRHQQTNGSAYYTPVGPLLDNH